MSEEIRIPQGMRDLIQDEVIRKQQLKNRIEEVFEKSGYSEIITPAIEYYNTYENAFSSMQDEEMYKFFDQDGRILTLRVDMTVPIARVCASKFTNTEPPYRFRYCSDVFKVRHTFAGKRSQVTDCGIELIGMDESADLEVLSTALDAMASFGIEDYTLEIGNSSFLKKACRAVNMDDDTMRILADLIDRKSMVELEEYLSLLNLSEEVSSFFLLLPMLGGKADVLELAEKVSFNEDLRNEVNKLKVLAGQLKELGYEDRITFDFGKAPHLDYYTGIIFEGYVSGSGSSVLSGGRYDNLLSSFGRDLPACGFSIKLDYLLELVPAFRRRRIRLLYPKGKEVEAVLKARELREEADVELTVYDGETLEVAL